MAQPKQRKGLGDILDNALAPESKKAGQDVTAEVVELEKVVVIKPKVKPVNSTLYLPKTVHRQIKELAFAEDVKPHDLYLEAMDMLFKQRGLKSIHDLTTA